MADIQPFVQLPMPDLSPGRHEVLWHMDVDPAGVRSVKVVVDGEEWKPGPDWLARFSELGGNVS